MSNLEYEISNEDGSRVEMFLFESEDGRYRWGFTTDAKSKTLGPVEFQPEPISRGELKQTAGDSNVEKLIVKVPFNNPVAVLHVPYLPPRPIRLTVYTYQRNDPAGEIVQAFTGFITNFNQKGGWAELECSQIIDALQQTVPWVVFKADCSWALYQIGCGVDKALYEELAPISAVIEGTTLESTEFASKPTDWYTNGFAVDPESGEERFITYHNATEGVIRVVYPFLYLKPGAVLKVYAGCDRHRDTCSAKFNNKINYLGFDHFPEYNVFTQGLT